MADVNEAATGSDRGSIVKAGSVSIPTLVINASVTFLVAIGLAMAAVAAQMSQPFLMTAVVLAVVGGCGVLSALVVSHTRKTALETRQVIIDAMNAHATQSETDLCDIKTALTRLTDTGTKNIKAVTKIASGLVDCKTLISAEVDTVNTELGKLRAAQYTLFADKPDAGTGTDGRPHRPFGVVN